LSTGRNCDAFESIIFNYRLFSTSVELVIFASTAGQPSDVKRSETQFFPSDLEGPVKILLKTTKFPFYHVSP
jgi:hypothetical protein